MIYPWMWWVLLSIGLCHSQASIAQTAAAPRQLMIVKPGTDRLLITWVAAVMNKGQVPERFAMPVLIPKEAKDFQPIEGISGDDLKLGDQGLSVEKEFAPGVNVISLGYTVQVAMGESKLNIKARSDVGELTVMTPRGLLEISGRELVDAGTDVQDMQRYAVLTSNRMILAGDELIIAVNGIPEGRGRLWVLGAGFAMVLLVASVLLARKSMPVKDAAVI